MVIFIYICITKNVPGEDIPDQVRLVKQKSLFSQMFIAKEHLINVLPLPREVGCPLLAEAQVFVLVQVARRFGQRVERALDEGHNLHPYQRGVVLPWELLTDMGPHLIRKHLWAEVIIIILKSSAGLQDYIYIWLFQNVPIYASEQKV